MFKRIILSLAEKLARQRENKWRRAIKRETKFRQYQQKHPEQWRIYTLQEIETR